MDFRPVAKRRKAGLTMPDGCTSPRPVTYIKSLAAPLLITQTGELCERLQLTPGTIYTIGRSKKACDIVFLDTRVSRRHCQLYVFPQNNVLTLLDGALPDAILRTQRETDLKEQGRRFFGRENKRRPQRLESTARIEKLCKIDRRRCNRSLNGMFVNGDLIDSGSCMVLSSGDEVSLVGPTKAGQSLDTNSHLAVGFTIETEPSTKKDLFAQSCTSAYAEICSDASILSHKRKRGAHCRMGDDSAVDRIGNAATMSVCSADNTDKLNENQREPRNFGTRTEKRGAQEDDFVVNERLHCRSEERCFGSRVKTQELRSALLLTLDHGKAENLNACDNESSKSIVTEKVYTTTEIGPKTSSLSSEGLNLDNQLDSTLNLIQASVRLRKCVSEFLNSYNKDDSSTDQMELQLTKTQGECPARRNTKWALHTSRESDPQAPLSFCRFASSLDVKLSNHPKQTPSRYYLGEPTLEIIKDVFRYTNAKTCLVSMSSSLETERLTETKDYHLQTELMGPNSNVSKEADHSFVKTPACVHNWSLKNEHEVKQSPEEFPRPLLRRDLKSSQGCLWQSDVIPTEIQLETEINVADWKEYSTCEKRNSQLGGFLPLEGEQLDEKRLCLGRATHDLQLSGKHLRTNLDADLSQLTSTSSAAQIMITDVRKSSNKGPHTSRTELHAGEVLQDDKYECALFTQSEFSEGLKDTTSAKLASYKEVGKITPCNTGMSSVAIESFDIRKQRCTFNSLLMSAEAFPEKLGKRNSEIMQQPQARSSVNVDDICQLIVEEQIGKFEAGDSKIRIVAEEKEISGWKSDLCEEPTGFLYSVSPAAGEKDLLRGQSLCVSASLDTVKDPDSCSTDCNHVKSATLQELKPSPVQRILALPDTSETKDDTLEKDPSVEPASLSHVNSDMESNKEISCALHDTKTGGLSLCKVASAEITSCSPESLPCVVCSKKESVIEEGALLCASKVQLEPVYYESKEMIGVDITTLHLNCKDDNLHVEMGEGRDTELQISENVSRKFVNLEVISGKKNLDPCSTYESQVLVKSISERAFLSKELDDALIRPDLCHMTSIGVTNSACTVLHINQEQSRDEKLEQSERLPVGGAYVGLGIVPNLMVKDQISKGVKTTDLQDWKSPIDSSYSSGYFLNQLKDVASEGSGHDISVSIQDLLAPVDDLEAVFVATFTYDLPWFLSFAGLSRDIPVTVACHNVDRCWSQSREDRCEKPYLDWPNVTLVYPPFPNVCAFGKGRKRRGIGCHHPKLFLLRRTSSIRVIISSANLTHRQWLSVTNNVWWQDFPFRGTSDFKSLFQEEDHGDSPNTADFASQLATFIAALLTDCPLEAHWVTDLADFNFSSAAGSLVASIPGLHHPLYHNAPEFLISLEKESRNHFQHGDSWSPKHLGVVATTVVGITYRFRASADPKGIRIRALAAILNEASAYVGLTMPVLLKRAKYVAADPNAVSVVVTSKAKGCSQDLFLQEDLHNADIHTLESDALQSEKDFVKLGFLPRDIASWLAVLCDRGFFSFAACIWPKEALAVASGQDYGVVKLALYVFQGPKFSGLSTTLLSTKEITAFCGLLKSLHRPWGLWRFEQVLSKYNWEDSEESDFFFGSSSIGTSLDAKFLAAFAAASGRRAVSSTGSQDSDPEWGCWTAQLEADNPSIGIVFPSIDRVQKDNFAQYGLLCFAESAWERLKSAHLLYDAVPYPPEREGFPMHAKVARRRFQKSASSRPYGWFYCGSHNFSPAAWGRPSWRQKDGEAATDAGTVLGSTLHIANYEIGIVLVEPPPPLTQQSGQGKHEISELENETARRGLDRFTMPFKMPPPKYKDSDRPATGKAMYEAFMEMKALELIAAEEDSPVLQSVVEVEGEAFMEMKALELIAAEEDSPVLQSDVEVEGEAFMEMNVMELMAAEEEWGMLQNEVPLEALEGEGEVELAQEASKSKGEEEYVEALWSQIDNQQS